MEFNDKVRVRLTDLGRKTLAMLRTKANDLVYGMGAVPVGDSEAE